MDEHTLLGALMSTQTLTPPDFFGTNTARPRCGAFYPFDDVHLLKAIELLLNIIADVGCVDVSALLAEQMDQYAV